MTSSRFSVAVAARLLQQISTGLLIGLAAGLSVATLAALAGLLPWIDLDARLGETVIADAGMMAQIGLTVLLLLMVGFLPGNSRIARLEMTNRNFQIGMDDVTRAYAAVHAADRAGAFELSREFDAMRERIAYMRAHPDLAGLEHDVLEVAAQMSVESRDLAAIYSDEKVDRAKAFLTARQTEVEDYREKLATAQSTVEEIKRWKQALGVEESLAKTQLERLRADLADLTEDLNLTDAARPPNVVGLSRKGSKPDKHATPAE